VIGYFVTGTDTNVGKTYVTSALAARACRRGHKVFAFKPIETGCLPDATGVLVGSDQQLLSTAAGGWQSGDARGVYRFPLPAAPLVAADRVGATVDLVEIERTLRGVIEEARPALTLVEGAGGWRVPITPEADMSGLAARLGYPIIIVARASLGTINHSLLTVEAVERDGATIAAVVLSRHPSDDAVAAASNQHQIQRRWPGRVVLLEQDNAVLDPLLPD
jgi:dethiobiotin synthetase